MWLLIQIPQKVRALQPIYHWLKHLFVMTVSHTNCLRSQMQTNWISRVWFLHVILVLKPPSGTLQRRNLLHYFMPTSLLTGWDQHTTARPILRNTAQILIQMMLRLYAVSYTHLRAHETG